jgi:hypothetical protein
MSLSRMTFFVASSVDVPWAMAAVAVSRVVTIANEITSDTLVFFVIILLLPIEPREPTPTIRSRLRGAKPAVPPSAGWIAERAPG